MKKIIIIVAIVMVILIIATVFLVKKFGSQGLYVRVGKVERNDITSRVVAFGRVQPTKEVTISAKVTGEIVKMYVEEGDTVQRGDTLLKVNPEQYIAQVEQMEASLRSARTAVTTARANLKQAEEEYERVKSMYEKGLTSTENFRRVETNYEVLRAQLNSAYEGVKRADGQLKEAKELLDETIIISPQSGVVIALYAEEGEYVVVGRIGTAGSSIMKVAQLAEMECKVDVDETDVPAIEEGQKVELEFDAFPDTIITGTVIKISNEAVIQGQGMDSEIATFPVRIAILENLEGLKSKMSVKADIITEEADSVLAVPIQAVVEKTPKDLRLERPGELKASRNASAIAADDSADLDTIMESQLDKKNRIEVVFLVEGNRAKAAPVKTGIMDDRFMEIKEGLGEGDEIVVGSYKNLRILKNNDLIQVLARERDYYQDD